jgi:saccharopine dehydrogenase-like NADP-dependent oxidoreductase
MARETVEKVRVLAEFGFAERDPVEVNGVSVVPRDLLISMLSEYVPPITEFLAPPKTQLPDWVKEIVTEVHAAKDGKELKYRMGTLTCKGALPTGVAPAVGAIWLAEGRIPPGVYPPEAIMAPETFFKELEKRGIYTQVTVTSKV